MRTVKDNTDKRAKIVKLIKVTSGKTKRGDMVEMLKRTGPKIDANGKYVNPTSALIW